MALGIDGERLETTAAAFSEHARRGEDPDFGRGTVTYVRRFAGDPANTPNPVLGPIDEAPFHGSRLRFVGTGIGASGVHIDGDGRVLDREWPDDPGAVCRRVLRRSDHRRHGVQQWSGARSRADSRLPRQSRAHGNTGRLRAGGCPAVHPVASRPDVPGRGRGSRARAAASAGYGYPATRRPRHPCRRTRPPSPAGSSRSTATRGRRARLPASPRHRATGPTRWRGSRPLRSPARWCPRRARPSRTPRPRPRRPPPPARRQAGCARTEDDDVVGRGGADRHTGRLSRRPRVRSRR